jgi:murein DD-endopeptidase MepM/ murein hydrolase activator NlpD
MSNLSKPKLFKFLATIAALSSVTAILTTAHKAEAIPLYPNDLVNNQVYRLQMEKSAPNGSPVTLNITQQFGFRNGGLVNTWIGSDGDSLFKYLTNGYGINFQRVNSNYSISVKDTNVTPGNTLNSYTSGFGRYQDWNLEKVGGDTYLFHWRTDIDTNLCLDIRGFGQGQQLNNQTPVVWYCDRNNVNQRIRVIKGQPALSYILPFQAGYKARLDQAWGAKTASGTGITHGPTPLAIDLTVLAPEYRASNGLWYSAAQARAIAAGQVIQASYQGVYGNTVVIRHDDGNTSQYSHLHNYAVQNGQRVSAGQNLGVIGMTASNASVGKNNVHLHFEMKDRNGKYITFQFRDASGVNFSQPGIEVTAQNP